MARGVGVGEGAGGAAAREAAMSGRVYWRGTREKGGFGATRGRRPTGRFITAHLSLASQRPAMGVADLAGGLLKWHAGAFRGW